MKLLLDEGVPLRSAQRLREMGFDASHVLELEWQGASDEFLLQQANQKQAVVIAFDSDFHRLLALSNATGPSVIRIREDSLSLENLSSLIAQTVRAQRDALSKGVVMSVTRWDLRVRTLPLRS